MFVYIPGLGWLGLIILLVMPFAMIKNIVDSRRKKARQAQREAEYLRRQKEDALARELYLERLDMVRSINDEYWARNRDAPVDTDYFRTLIFKRFRECGLAWDSSDSLEWKKALHPCLYDAINGEGSWLALRK